MSIASKVAGKLSKSGLAKLKKLMQKVKDKKATKAVPKKADKRIEGSGAQSARPKGSIGKTRTQDSPRGNIAGASMSAAKKQQIRKTANLPTKKNKQGVSPAMKRAYEDIPPKTRTTLMAIISTGDKDRIRKAFARVDMSMKDFIAVRKQFTGGR